MPFAEQIARQHMAHLLAGRYKHTGGGELPEYNWSCLACHTGNDKNIRECTKCGCSVGANAYEVDAREVLIMNIETENKLDCPNCSTRSLDVKYAQDPKKYYYSGFKARSHIFEILNIEIYCKSCSYKNIIEFDVPFFRKVFRWVMKRDVQSERLKCL